MPLSTKHKQALKAKAHHLKPVVLLGDKGLTEAVTKEINRALNDHELIKIKINGQDREARKQAIHEICTELEAELVQIIGNTGVLYRKNQD